MLRFIVDKPSSVWERQKKPRHFPSTPKLMLLDARGTQDRAIRTNISSSTRTKAQHVMATVRLVVNDEESVHAVHQTSELK